MEADGDVVRIDVGRANLVAFPGEEPGGTKSPLDPGGRERVSR